MIVYIGFVLVYVGVLVLIRPSPGSLKSDPITYRENALLVWASVLSGVLVLSVFLLITNFSFVTVDEDLYFALALSNTTDEPARWTLQSITHLLVHGNLIHLSANVVGLGLASVYERRVGSRRYFSVLLVGCLASIPSIFFYSEEMAVAGISGGVFGLAAAYFTDECELSTREWLGAIFLFLFLMTLMAVDAELAGGGDEVLDMKMDHVGHLLGALGAIIYCRLRPLRASTGNGQVKGVSASRFQ